MCLSENRDACERTTESDHRSRYDVLDLGMPVRRETEGTILDQKQYAQDVLNRFHDQHRKKLRITSNSSDSPATTAHIYVVHRHIAHEKLVREIFGSLAKLANETHQDLSQPVSQLSRTIIF